MLTDPHLGHNFIKLGLRGRFCGVCGLRAIVQAVVEIAEPKDMMVA